MSRRVKPTILVAVIIAFPIISQIVFAQNANFPITKFNCTSAPNITINSTAFNGTWFAVSRKTFVGDKSSQACVKLDLNITEKINNKNSTMKATITYSVNNLKNSLKNTTSVLLEMSNNILKPSTSGLTLKIVATNYTSYAFVCVYPNVPANAAAFILSRDKSINRTALGDLEKLAALNYTDFQGMQPIDQNCTKSASSSLVAVSWTFLTLSYLFGKWLD